MKDSVIIIGGGAAGLMLAYELSKQKKQITVLEAKSRLGGRIFTLNNNFFSQPAELGAEFIHGDLPVTLLLLQEAKVAYHVTNSKLFYLEKGKFKKRRNNWESWNTLLEKMNDLKEDITLADFLSKYFPDDKFSELTDFVKSFAGGFDLAEISAASTKSLYHEWNEEMGNQYRIKGGYQQIINYLEKQCKRNGCHIETNCCAKKISWQKNEVNVLTMCSRLFKSNKVVLAVPLSVLQANVQDESYIEFTPLVSKHIDAARNIGYGQVIKIILEFSENFWNKKKKDAGLIITDEEVPTWWSQLPVESTILTGWVGGEKAVELNKQTDKAILEAALRSLAAAFDIPLAVLQEKLKAYKIANWNREENINGGYSFNTLKSNQAKKILKQPVNDTIFFTGEALFEGTPLGTVEAALSSGKETARQLLKII